MLLLLLPALWPYVLLPCYSHLHSGRMCAWLYCSLNMQDGWTPLQVAVQNGHLGVAELLLAKGADIEAKHSRVGATFLHDASSGC